MNAISLFGTNPSVGLCFGILILLSAVSVASGLPERRCEMRQARAISLCLPASGLLVLEQSHFRVERRILRHDNQVIDGIQSETNSVKRLVRGQAKWKMHLSQLK